MMSREWVNFGLKSTNSHNLTACQLTTVRTQLRLEQLKQLIDPPRLAYPIPIFPDHFLIRYLIVALKPRKLLVCVTVQQHEL